MEITLSHFSPWTPRGVWGRREITHPCQASKGKQGACHTAESRDPVSPISGVYPTAQGFKTTYQPVCQMSDLRLCRANILLSTLFFIFFFFGSVLLSLSGSLEDFISPQPGNTLLFPIFNLI